MRKRSKLGTSTLRGFTLIEVLVAFSILSLTLAALFALLSAGTRNTRVADEYSRAVVFAETKMAELGVTAPLRSGTTQGRFDEDYLWELRVGKPLRHEVSLDPDEEWELLELTLRVAWQSMGQERDITLSTLRVVARP